MRYLFIFLWAFLFLSASAPLLHAGGKTAGATCEEMKGILLARGKDGWVAVTKGAQAPVGVSLVALTEAKLVSPGGLVLEMKADIGKHTPLPVLESAIVLHENKEFELDLSLGRGIIVLSNPTAKGDLKARVRLWGDTKEITLRPGSRLGLELYARYAPGALKEFTGKLEDPSAQLLGLVLKGRVFMKIGDTGVGLQAPPGLALFQWDNLEKKLHATRLDKLPEFIKPLTAEEKKLFERCNLAAATLAEKDKAKAIQALLAGDDRAVHLTAVAASGMLDEVDILLGCLEDANHPDVRDQAILVLRHYLGRGPEQVQRVYRTLTAAKVSPIQAGLFIELLLGFTEEQRSQPQTYEILLRLLDHPRLGVRELSHWHLRRLVVLEKDIPYDPAGPLEDRQKALRSWRELIPTGELPPHLREKK